MAEGEGFEPPLPVRVKRFSRPPVSTTHTSLREWRCTFMIALRRAKAIRCLANVSETGAGTLEADASGHLTPIPVLEIKFCPPSLTRICSDPMILARLLKVIFCQPE